MQHGRMRRTFTVAVMLLASASTAIAASTPIVATIAFEGAGSAASGGDVVFSLPPVAIRINSYGQTYDVVGADSSMRKDAVPPQASNAGWLILENPIRQLVNFFPNSYRRGDDIIPISATCSVNGALNNDCKRVYPSYDQSTIKLRIGMTALVLNQLTEFSSLRPAFDFFIIYQ